MQKDIIINELKKVILGKDDVLEKLLIALLAKGHVLLEDMPGVGKTTMALAFAKLFDIEYKRMQFTGDTLPSDVTGFIMYDKDEKVFSLKKGPIFTNLFLADEINRTSPKTQSALLEVMEERQVTIDANSYAMAEPFMVIATQNPYGSSGTNLLPQSQMDRFMMALSIGYPDKESEVAILKSRHHSDPLNRVEKLVDKDTLVKIQKYIETIYVSDEIYEYVINLIRATRKHPKIAIGASIRAGLALMRLAKARAYIYERDYVTPRDIEDLYLNTLSHRIVLKNHDFSAVSLEREAVLNDIFASVKMPDLKG